MEINTKKSWVHGVAAPDALEEKKIIGRKLAVKDDHGVEKEITVVDIKPNLSHIFGKRKGKAPLYQVQDGLGEWYLVSTIRVFATLSEEKISEAEIKDFEHSMDNTEFDVVPPGNRKERRAFRKVNGLWRN